MIPVSTAHSDPKWYHKNMGKQFTYLDKNGVVNGLRCEELHPDESCAGLCGGADMCATGEPDNCAFLKAYRTMLDKIDLRAWLNRAEASAAAIKERNGFKEEPIIVLIVHETPKNKCSERSVLLEYFKDNNIECEELRYPINENYS